MYIIGIAGGSGSGKTTFAKKIASLVLPEWTSRVALIHQDAYYLQELPPELYNAQKEKNVDHPKAFDWSLLKEHIKTLKQGKDIQGPIYDFVHSRRSEQTDHIRACDIIILEGIYALWDEEIRNILDLKIYLHIDSDIRFIRRLHRDIKERGRSIDTVINRYYATVRPMHKKYLEPTNQFADLIVGEDTDAAARVVAAQIHEQLGLKKL